MSEVSTANDESKQAFRYYAERPTPFGVVELLVCDSLRPLIKHIQKETYWNEALIGNDISDITRKYIPRRT